MLDIDWKQDKPPLDTESELWDEVTVESVPVSNPNVDVFLEQLRFVTSPHGGAEFACFKLGESPALDWYASRRRLQETDFITHFLRRPAVTNALLSLNITNPLLKAPSVPLGTPLTLDGILAHHLCYGGAYKSFGGTPHEAKILAGAFCSSLWGERLGEIDLYVTYTAWTDWFFGNGWDYTCFGLDKRYRHLWVLCKTSSDTKNGRNRWEEPPVKNIFKSKAFSK